jgi:hypothetical protein
LFADQRVLPVAGKIDSIRFCCHVQQTKYSSQLRCMFGLDTGYISCFEKLFQPFVSDELTCVDVLPFLRVTENVLLYWERLVIYLKVLPL